VPAPLWFPDSEDPAEGLREAEGEWRRLKRLTLQQREEERRKEAERNLEGIKSDADLNVSLAKGELEARVRQAQRADTAYLEASKLDFDIFKTRATLAIGSIAGVAAVASLLRPGLDYELLVVASIVLLLVCMVVSLDSMRFVTAAVYVVPGTPDPDRIDRFTETNSPKLKRRDRASYWSLAGGIVLFTIFALLNLAYPTGDFLEVVRDLLSK
jgi:hypothetical protein